MPHRGHSTFQTLLVMQDCADIEVLCPLSTYPPWRWLQPKGYQYHPPDLTWQPPGPKATYFTYPALPVVTRLVNGWICERALKRHFRGGRPDVILNYWLYPEGFAAVGLAKKLGVPVIVGAIGSDLRRNTDPVTRHFVRRTLREADAVLTVSQELRRQAIALGAAPEKVTAILNGCDRALFRPGDRAAARHSLNLPADAEVLLYVGSLAPAKGVPELVIAALALFPARPNLRLVLVGDGIYRQTAERIAADSPYRDRILFAGQVPSTDVALWMTAADAFTLPSHSEGCPNVIVEAIACGRPVIATSVGGIPELVNESCGILVAPRDEPALRKGIETVLDRQWDAAAISEQFGRGWDQVSQETYYLCKRVAGR